MIVTPDPRGLLTDGREAHLVALFMACPEAAPGRNVLQYEAVPAEDIRPAGYLLLHTHHVARPQCRCCAGLEQLYGVLP